MKKKTTILLSVILFLGLFIIFVYKNLTNFNQNDSANDYTIKLPYPYFIKADETGTNLLYLTKSEDHGDASYPPQNVLVSKVTGIGYTKNEIIFSADFDLTDRFTDKRFVGKRFGYINTIAKRYETFPNRNNLNKAHPNLSRIKVENPQQLVQSKQDYFYKKVKRA